MGHWIPTSPAITHTNLTDEHVPDQVVIGLVIPLCNKTFSLVTVPFINKHKGIGPAEIQRCCTDGTWVV